MFQNFKYLNLLQITHFLIRAISIRVTWWVEGEIEKLLVLLHIGFQVLGLDLEQEGVGVGEQQMNTVTIPHFQQVVVESHHHQLRNL